MKNLKSYLKSAKFKVSEKYKMKYFGQAEKIFFIFFISTPASFDLLSFSQKLTSVEKKKKEEEEKKKKERKPF